jgi:hypothetical protein
MTRTLIAVAALVLMAVPSVAAAGGLGSMPLAKKATPLLGDHVTARFPSAAKPQPRGHSVMAAANPVEEETRVVLDDGKKRFVVMTYEVFATSGSNFEKAVRKEVKQFFSSGAAYSVRAQKIGNFKRAFVMQPSKIDGTEGANLVMGAYLAHPDGTVQFIAFYANPEAATKDADGCTKLAEAILATVRAGSKKLHTDGGAQTLFAWQHVLHVDLPRGWILTTTQGPDFVVHRARQMAPFGEPAASLGIYLGGHPNAQYNQLGAETKRVERKGKLAGADTVWHSWTDATGLLRKEALASGVAPGDTGLAIHVFMAGPAEPDIAMMDALAATLRLTKK